MDTVTESPAERARAAARNCETAGLTAEADMLYRLAETLEAQDRAAAAASLARVLIGRRPHRPGAPLRPRRQRPRPRRAPAARGPRLPRRRGGCSTRRGSATPSIRASPRRAAGSGFSRSASREAVVGPARGRAAAARRPARRRPTADSCARRARSRPGQIPAWKEAVARGPGPPRRRGRAGARPESTWPDRSAELLRSLIRRGAAVLRGRARARAPARGAARAPGPRRGRALLRRGRGRAAAARDRQRRSTAPATRAGGDLVRRPGLARARRARRPVGDQPMGEAHAGRLRRRGGARRRRRARATRGRAGAVTLLGFTPDFFSPEPDRARLAALPAHRAWRAASAGLNDLFRQFFPDDAAPAARGPAAGARRASRPRALARRPLALADHRRPRRVGPLPLRGLRRGEALPRRARSIFREGDAGDAIYVIARGRVRISRQISGGEEAFAILSPGEIFGEMALLDPGSGPLGRRRRARGRGRARALARALRGARGGRSRKAAPSSRCCSAGSPRAARSRRPSGSRAGGSSPGRADGRPVTPSSASP